MAFSFEKLLVYQKAVDFADKICDHTEQFERGYGFLADQRQFPESVTHPRFIRHFSPTEAV